LLGSSDEWICIVAYTHIHAVQFIDSAEWRTHTSTNTAVSSVVAFFFSEPSGCQCRHLVQLLLRSSHQHNCLHQADGKPN
jgi:hypothetical protein